MLYDLVTTDTPTHWQVHKHACKDVGKLRRQSCRVETLEHRTAQDLVTHELALDRREQGYTEADFKIMPCCKGD